MSVGIDFGTTNSSLGAFRQNGTGRDVGDPDREHSPLPSVVAINRRTGLIQVGRDAWAHQRERSADENWEIISSIKSLLGTTDWRRDIAGREWTPVDVAAAIIAKLKQESDPMTDNHAVVSIPVGFRPEQRIALRQAARKAGIEIDSFTSESTAAFVNCMSTMRAATYVVVFDWGGGTLDISILKHSNNEVQELATSGLNKAGDFIDKKLAKFIHAAVARGQGIDCPFEDMPAQYQDRLIVRCEEAKRTLSDEQSATISILRDYGKFKPFAIPVNRDWFIEFVKPEIDQAIDTLQTALREAHVGAAQIDRILVVGGSSKLISLRERLIHEFDEDRLVFPNDPEWSVSRGATLLGAAGVRCRSCQDVGIVLSTGASFPLLRRGTPIDNWMGRWTFGLTDTTQEARLVFTGSDDIDYSPERMRILPVPSYKFLQERLILDARIDENRLFHVSAHSDKCALPKSGRPVWTYDRLKFSYEVPKDAYDEKHSWVH